MTRPWWVRRCEAPPYELDLSAYSRFDQRKSAFSLYPELMEAMYRREESHERLARALSEGAASLRYGPAGRHLYDWNGPVNPQPYAAEPAHLNAIVKRAACFYGAGDVGVALLDRRHVYSHDGRGRPIVFADVPLPEQSEERCVIPERCRYVVALAVPQSPETAARAPHPLGGAAVSLGYTLMPLVAGSLSRFIRSLGYVAIPAGNDTALSVPISIDAGLGELGRTSRLISPYFGPNVRLAKVITDLPLAVDRPIRFGVSEFCRVCMKCARECPAGAINSDREPGFETRGEFNNPGYSTWYEDARKCLEFWARSGSGCSICVRVCPYNKLNNSLPHRAVKAAIARLPVLHPLSARADDWAGYGRPLRAGAWWETQLGPFGWPRWW